MWHVRVSVHQLPDCKGSFLFLFPSFSLSSKFPVISFFSPVYVPPYSIYAFHLSTTPPIWKVLKVHCPSSRFLMKVLSNIFSQYQTPRVSINTRLPVGLCATEHHPVVQTLFHKLYHPLLHTLFPIFDCEFTMGDCSKSHTMVTNNTHCSSLVTSSQKVISYSAVCSTGISIVLFLILWRENSANRSHKNQSTWISIWRQSWITLQCQ